MAEAQRPTMETDALKKRHVDRWNNMNWEDSDPDSVSNSQWLEALAHARTLERQRDALRERVKEETAISAELSKMVKATQHRANLAESRLTTLTDAARRLAEAWQHRFTADYGLNAAQGDAAAAAIERMGEG